MSRTIKRQKGPGYEYWKSRSNKHAIEWSPGKWAKTKTHKLERQQAKKDSRNV